jgi:hypothetical protein
MLRLVHWQKFAQILEERSVDIFRKIEEAKKATVRIGLLI